MTQWNRTTLPTEADADEWDNILVLRENGQKAVYHWEDYNEHYATEETAWMPLPPSDVPQAITITISSGGHSFTIEKVGSRIEVHDSHDPMGQPIISEEVDGLDGVLRMVESILVDGFIEAPDDDDDCGCEGVLVNDVELQNFIDAIRGKTPEPKIWQKNRGK